MNLEKEFINKDKNGCLVLFKSLSDSEKDLYFPLIVEKHPDFVMNAFFPMLSPQLRLKYISHYKPGIFVHDDLLLDTDDITKFEILKYIFIHEDNHTFALSNFKELPYQYKEEFLKVMYETEQKTGIQAIYSFNLDDYIKEFDYQDRLRIIEEIIIPNFSACIQNSNDKNQLNGFSLVYLLKSFNDCDDHQLNVETLYKLLDFLFDYYEDSKNDIAHNAVDIFKVFQQEGVGFKEFFSYIFPKVNIKLLQLCRISDILPKETRKEFVYFAIDTLGIKSFSYMDFISLIHTLSNEEMEAAFVHYLIDEPKVNYFKVLNYTYCLDHFMIMLRHVPVNELNLNSQTLIDELSTNERYLNYEEKYQPIVRFFAGKYKLNIDNFTNLVKKFGFTAVKYINNSSIRAYIELPQEQFDKILGLFSNDTLHFDNRNINDILNSILQRKFMYENPSICNIFSFFEEHLSSKDYPKIEMLLKDIGQEINIDDFLAKRGATFEDLMQQIYMGDASLLHDITNRYIAYKREQYAGKHMSESKHSLDIRRVYSRNKYKEKYIQDFLYSIAIDCKEVTDVTFTENQQKLIEDSSLVSRLVKFKKNPKGVELAPGDKKYLRALNELLDIFYEHKINLYDLSDRALDGLTDNDIELVQNKLENHYLLGILVETTPNVFINVINNPELYEKLQQFLTKYKLLGWDKTFSELLTSCSITFDEGTLGSLLTNFEKIAAKIDEKKSLTAIVDYANCYSSTSKLYSLIFGADNYRLIGLNPKPNQATANRYDRINKNIDMIPKMYKRDSITTPSFEKNFELSNGKNINVNLGNITNMINLTYGERTGSCMRQCGAFDSLFHHCIEDINGFHVRFSDPISGKLISRVSGTRNGNTVFFNELRESLNPEVYSNDDLYEYIKMVADYLVNQSKNSSCPIDNVVIVRDIALSKRSMDEIDLNLDGDSKKQALRNVSFNFTSGKGILLASSNNESLVDYKFTDDLPKYPTIRDAVREYHNSDARDRVNQLRLINEVINSGKENLDVFVLNEEMPIVAISGEDFYIAQYPDRIETFELDIAQNNPRTLEEMKMALGNIKGSVKR